MDTDMDYRLRLDVEIKKKLKGFDLDVNFQTGKGCLGILGPSGCGKSMTLKSIAGIISPDKGRIELKNIQNPDSHSRILYDSQRKISEKPQTRQVGYLFQNYALFPNMTIEQNIMAGLSRKKAVWTEKKQRAKTAEMIRCFRLDGLEKRYPAQLSGGQQQRTALARILAYEPDVILLDEPFSAMDAYLREELRLELAKVLKSYDGISIMVTHDRDEAYQLCSRLLLMDQGRVLTEGDTKSVFQKPGTCQAARLTGCKNISRIQRIGKYRIKALDWKGLEFVTEQPVGEEITAVGIRAHDFEPLSREEAMRWRTDPRGNLIPAKHPVISEMPFEWYITFDNGLWWKIEKGIHMHDPAGVVPEWLRIDPEAMILLTGEP